MSQSSRISVGDAEVITLQDGATEFGKEVFPNADPDQIDSILSSGGASAIETSFNAFVVRRGDTIVLVDSGVRDLFGPVAGRLPEALKDVGISPGDVSHLVLTHLHPDHIAGAIDADGNAVFGNAEAFVTEAEHAFWTDDGNFAGADSTTTEWQALANSALAAYGDRVTLVSGDAELAGGVTLIDLPGHTPGHVGFRVDSGADSFVSICDVLHSQVLQLADPEICAAFDGDRPAAIQSRKRVLDMVAADRLPFSGGHILGAEICHLERSGSGYRLV